MRLGEALKITGKSAAGPPRSIHLLCGFTPLHLETFIKARVMARLPASDVLVLTGLFDDLEGNLQRASQKAAEGAIAVIEWSDLDRRLGFRASAGWSTAALVDIAAQVQEACSRLIPYFEELQQQMPVVLVPPTLALLPLTHLPPSQTDQFELDLQAVLANFLQDLGRSGIRVIGSALLATTSPPALRQDLRMELLAGFPYTVPHADAVAELSVQCLFPEAPRKGLITDLDQTLWKGILGDVGTDGVSWSLEAKSQEHALYQQLLASLADSGSLIAIASKNDAELVSQALLRGDLLISPAQIFPVEANWGPKSHSVERILKTWNIGADSVVFVDDSPLELAEVAERFPVMECLQFPSGDATALLLLLRQLRARFGKSEVREEDRLRLGSIRDAAGLHKQAGDRVSGDFLSRLEAKVKIEPAGVDSRAFELVNKTNQFNLNGITFTEAEWKSKAERIGAFLFSVTYEDRFGPLGRIAVIGGIRDGSRYVVDTWVLSCRAFSRQIEHQSIRQLFAATSALEVRFLYKPTGRNGPTKTFFEEFFPSAAVYEGALDLSASWFEEKCPVLYHQVTNKWITSELE